MSQTRWILLFVGAMALFLVLGVGLMYAMYSSVVGDVAPYQFRLPGSTWAVESVDGEAVDRPAPLLVLDEAGDSATLVLSCGEIALDWVWDSDGNAVGFLPVGGEADCPGTASERGLVVALTLTEEWRAVGDRAIDVIVIDQSAGNVRLILVE